jgi:hypothetical protein
MSLPALYQLRSEYVELLNKLADADLDAQTIADTLEGSGLQESIADKAQNIVAVLTQMDSNCEAIDAEIKRLKELKDRRKANAEKLEEYLIFNMEAADIQSIEAPLFTIKIRNNPESVDVFEPALVPEEYMEWPSLPPKKPAKALIKTALKSGVVIQGVRLVRSKSISVK